MAVFIVSFIIIFGLIYIWLKQQLQYWKNKGIPYLEPTILVGNLGESVLLKKNPGSVMNDIYRKYEDLPFVGIFKGQTPCLLVRDPQFIKNILIKDFKHFANNAFDVDKNVDQILGRHHFFVKDEKWQESRSEVTPAFTPARMKGMCTTFASTSCQMIDFINKSNSSNEIMLEAKDICTRFAVDNAADCALGLEGKCFHESKSYIKQISEGFFSPGGRAGFVIILITIFPWLTKYTNVKLVPKKVEDKLLAIAKKSLEYRKQNNIVRPDLLDFLGQLEIPDIDTLTHAVNFFAADAIETTSITMSSFLFELAFNQTAQNLLRKEVNSVFDKNEGKFNYDALQDMPYLDACFYESLRKNRVFGHMTKSCTKEYSYTSNGQDFQKMSVNLQPGDTVVIPLAIHTDPKYYPEPEKFKPERFLNNTNNSPLLVFSDGPRECLGQRFALLQIKIGVAYIIKNFHITVNKKTRFPFEYLPYYFMYVPKGGIWLNFSKIES